ncbi:MAG TPA: hypothetical protein VFP69_15100 [Streptomyces sp.]|nr:hypothetical protein [Streptomyces sp.]
MSGDTHKPDPHQAEHQAADKQNGTLDAFTDMTSAVSPFGSGSIRGFHFGTTSFEGHDLNEMIDIVRSAGPELLESAGDALLDARDAIKAAADELKTNLGDVDWEGEAHKAFTTWGQSLAATAGELAGYADIVGRQVLAAGSGLASVRKSMPPPDHRTDRKKVEDIPEAKRVESNDEYTAAVKAEKHRQEAINQMYRLASFYTVSHGTMAKAEEPVFPRMPDAGVPKPKQGVGVESPPPGSVGIGPPNGPGQSGELRHDSVNASAERPEADVPLPSARGLDDSGAGSSRHVGTEIDSVGMLPPQATAKPEISTPLSAPGPQAPSLGGVPPLPDAAAPPFSRRGAGPLPRANGLPGVAGPAPVQGRDRGVLGASQSGRAGNAFMGPKGRASAAEQTGSRQVSSMGRGLVGGVPKSGGPASRQAGSAQGGPVANPAVLNSGSSGARRLANGVVGGKPVASSVSDTSAAKLPRGTVVGGEDSPVPRRAGEKPGQRGVVGAPNATTEPEQTAGRPGEVVGTPNSHIPGNGGDGRTAGSTGRYTGPASPQNSGETRSRHEDRRGGVID